LAKRKKVKPKITYKEITLILGIIIALLVAYTLSGYYQTVQLSSFNSLFPRITSPLSYEGVIRIFSGIVP
jgi:hypothetical protein